MIYNRHRYEASCNNLAAEKTPKKNEMDGAVARMGDRRGAHRGLRGVLRERDYVDDLSVHGLY
jgi:hypothetical protein